MTESSKDPEGKTVAASREAQDPSNVEDSDLDQIVGGMAAGGTLAAGPGKMIGLQFKNDADRPIVLAPVPNPQPKPTPE